MDGVKVVGLFARKNPFECQSEWSGTVYRIRQSLEKAGYNVKWIPYNPGKLKWALFNIGVRAIHGFHSKTRQLDYYAKLCADSVDKSLVESCDILFFPGGGEMLPYLSTDKPAVYVSDATFRLMSSTYYTGNSEWCRKRGERRAKRTYKAFDAVITTSNWARDSFINDYGLDPDRVFLLHFGANMDASDFSPSVRDYKQGDELKILFSGVDWKRKGGDTAVEAVRILRRSGIDASLTITGVRKLPRRYASLQWVRNLGFLRKGNPDEYARYLQAFRQSHLFMLPTRAECAGIVFCEAAAFGLPSVTSDTGGIADYVINGINGFRLPADASPQAYADEITRLLTTGQLPGLSKQAVNLFNDSLNWHNWSVAFPAVFAKAVENNKK